MYNLLHYKELLHNKKAYKKYNDRKSIIASVSSKDFPDKDSRAWLDVGDSALLASQKEGFHQFSPEIQQHIIQWSRKGYIILNNYFSPGTCDAINDEDDKLMKSGTLQFKWGNKLMFANKKSELIRRTTKNKEISQLLNFFAMYLITTK